MATVTPIETFQDCEIVKIEEDGKSTVFQAFEQGKFRKMLGWGATIEEAREIIAEWNEE